MKIHILDQAEDDLVDGHNFYAMKSKSKESSPTSLIAYTRTSNPWFCMPESIKRDTKAIGECFLRGFRLQFITRSQETK